MSLTSNGLLAKALRRSRELIARVSTPIQRVLSIAALPALTISFLSAQCVVLTLAPIDWVRITRGSASSSHQVIGDSPLTSRTHGFTVTAQAIETAGGSYAEERGDQKTGPGDSIPRGFSFASGKFGAVTVSGTVRLSVVASGADAQGRAECSVGVYDHNGYTRVGRGWQINGSQVNTDRLEERFSFTLSETDYYRPDKYYRMSCNAVASASGGIKSPEIDSTTSSASITFDEIPICTDLQIRTSGNPIIMTSNLSSVPVFVAFENNIVIAATVRFTVESAPPGVSFGIGNQMLTTFTALTPYTVGVRSSNYQGGHHALKVTCLDCPLPVPPLIVTLQPECTISPEVRFYDPVTLLNPNSPGTAFPTMLKDSTISSTRSTLLNPSARQVMGAAADGITQLVVRIKACPSATYAITLKDESGSPPLNFKDTIGELGLPGDNDFNTRVQVIDTDEDGWGIVTYRSPMDYTRELSDFRSASRDIIFEVSGGSRKTTTTLFLIRPMVLLIHGLGSDSSVWDSFESIMNRDGVLTVERFDYGELIPARSIGLFNPPYTLIADRAARRSLRQSHLGNEYNASALLLAVTNDILPRFRRGDNAKGIAVAAAQLDIVAHSLGGLIARTMAGMPGYTQPSNYYRGFVHKMVTLGTPHRGSPQAIHILSPENGCVRNNSLGIYFLAGNNFSSVQINGTWINGATGDLKGNGTGRVLSPVLRAMSDRIPVSMYAGTLDGQELALDYGIAASSARALCPSAPLAQRLTSSTYSTIFDPTPEDGLTTAVRSDAIVPLSSATDSNTGLDPAARIAVNTVHGEGTLSLGFPGPHLLSAGIDVPANVAVLLNTKVSDPLFRKPQ